MQSHAHGLPSMCLSAAGALNGVWKCEILNASLSPKSDMRSRHPSQFYSFIFKFKYIRKKGGNKSCHSPLSPSVSPSTEMRRDIVFDMAADSRNTYFEKRCLLLLLPLLCDGKPRSRSNLITLRVTLSSDGRVGRDTGRIRESYTM